MKFRDKNTDDVQPATVDEHFKILMAGEDTIESELFAAVTSTDLPEWFDEELFEEGQRYYKSNLLGVFMASFCGLVAVLSVPSILEILIFTKESGTPCKAFKRYLETFLHTRVMASMNMKNKDSDWYKSVNTVRFKHCNASGRALRKGLGGITQRDMALTQFGFIGYVLLRPECLGLTNTRREREGYNHLWRVIGHMLGISDRMNICRETEVETTELCKKLQDQVFAKYLKELPSNFISMTETMLDGVWCIDLTTDKDAVMAFTYQLNGLSYHKKLSLYSWLNLKLREAAHKLCGLPYIGRLVRGYFYYYLEFNSWLLQKWPLVARLSYGTKESQIHMYPKLK